MDPHHDLRTDASTVAAVDVGEPTPEPISTEPTPEPTSTDPTSSSEPTSKESTSGETTCTPSEHTYKFEVQMSCKGCSGAVERALKKAKENNENGIADYHVNFDKKEVIVKGTISLEKAAATIEKTGKTISSQQTVE